MPFNGACHVVLALVLVQQLECTFFDVRVFIQTSHVAACAGNTHCMWHAVHSFTLPFTCA